VAWKPGRSVQAGHEAIPKQFIIAAKADEPADKAVPVAVFGVIHNRHCHIAFFNGMSANFAVGTTKKIPMLDGRRGFL
jgi:hypothetical protein